MTKFKAGDKVRCTFHARNLVKGEVYEIEAADYTTSEPKIYIRGHTSPYFSDRFYLVGEEPVGKVISADELVANIANDLTPERPPIGLRPRYIVDALRAQEILEAMHRYVSASKSVPESWVQELFDVVERDYDL